jgi:hypothetical protein
MTKELRCGLCDDPMAFDDGSGICSFCESREGRGPGYSFRRRNREKRYQDIDPFRNDEEA